MANSTNVVMVFLMCILCVAARALPLVIWWIVRSFIRVNVDFAIVVVAPLLPFIIKTAVLALVFAMFSNVTARDVKDELADIRNNLLRFIGMNILSRVDSMLKKRYAFYGACSLVFVNAMYVFNQLREKMRRKEDINAWVDLSQEKNLFPLEECEPLEDFGEWDLVAHKEEEESTSVDSHDEDYIQLCCPPKTCKVVSLEEEEFNWVTV